MVPPSGGDDSRDNDGPKAPEPVGPQVVAWPVFQRELERLQGKYPHVIDDLREALESPTTRRDAVPGYAHQLFKLRIRSRDMQRGSRGGFRLYVWIEPSTPPALPTAYLVTIYAKSEREDLSREQMRHVLKRFFDWLSALSVSNRK